MNTSDLFASLVRVIVSGNAAIHTLLRILSPAFYTLRKYVIKPVKMGHMYMTNLSNT